MKYLTTREIQLAELDILKKFIAFCNENNLTYWLYGGTALGAIRHNGFIPWDDDIDIIMPRSDYDKMTQLINDGKKVGDNLMVVIPELEKNPKYLIGKVYDKTIQVEAKNGHDNGYLWIDIMQLDGLPNDSERYRKKLLMLRRIYLAKMKQKYHTYDATKTHKDNVIRKIRSLPLYFLNYHMFMDYYLKFCKKYNYEESKYVSNTCWYNTPTKVFEKEWFSKTKQVKFEDIEANICAGYDEFLSKRYGENYMEIPPREEQATHSFKAWRISGKRNDEI